MTLSLEVGWLMMAARIFLPTEVLAPAVMLVLDGFDGVEGPEEVRPWTLVAEAVVLAATSAPAAAAVVLEEEAMGPAPDDVLLEDMINDDGRNRR